MAVPEIAPLQIPADALLLDVRNDDEWQAGHAPSAVHLPMGAVVSRLDEIPEDRQVVVICKVGARSAQVAEYLNRVGRSAVNVAGGMVAWQRAGLPIESSSGAPPAVI